MQPDTLVWSSAGNCRKLQSLHLHAALGHTASNPWFQSPLGDQRKFAAHEGSLHMLFYPVHTAVGRHLGHLGTNH